MLYSNLRKPEEIVDLLGHFSRQIPEVPHPDVLRAGPEFFRGPIERIIKPVETNFETMFSHAVQRMVAKTHQKQFNAAIHDLKSTYHYDHLAVKAVNSLKKSKALSKHHSPILLNAALTYLGASHTFLHLCSLGLKTPSEFERHFQNIPSHSSQSEQQQIKINRLEAARHFDRLANLHRISEEFHNFMFEQNRYDTQINQFNRKKIPGVEQHLLVTHKPAFFSIYPSVFGGDTFQINEIKNQKGEYDLTTCITDEEGKAGSTHSRVNHGRNLIIGMDEGPHELPLITPPNVAPPVYFLQQHQAKKDRVLSDAGLNATSTTLYYEPRTGKGYAVSSGHDPIVIAHPKKGVRFIESKNVPLGVDPRPADQYEHSEFQLEHGEVVLQLTDFYEDRTNSRNNFQKIVAKFNSLTRRGVSLEIMADQLRKTIKKLRGGKPFDDDGRIHLFRRTN